MSETDRQIQNFIQAKLQSGEIGKEQAGELYKTAIANLNTSLPLALAQVQARAAKQKKVVDSTDVEEIFEQVDWENIRLHLPTG